MPSKWYETSSVTLNYNVTRISHLLNFGIKMPNTFKVIQKDHASFELHKLSIIPLLFGSRNQDLSLVEVNALNIKQNHLDLK